MRICACRLPQFGDVVEYPLREIEMRQLQDGRTAGVRRNALHSTLENIASIG